MSSAFVANENEAAILLALYEAPNGTHTSYTLAWKLNPTVEPGTPPAGVAFTQTRAAIEQLISRGLVQGDWLTGADGVYFNKLKLTTKGEQMAIRQKQESNPERTI